MFSINPPDIVVTMGYGDSIQTILFLLLVVATLVWWEWRFGAGYLTRRVRRWLRRN